MAPPCCVDFKHHAATGSVSCFVLVGGTGQREKHTRTNDSHAHRSERVTSAERTARGAGSTHLSEEQLTAGF